MLPSLAEAGLLSLTFVVPLVVVVLLSPPFIKYLRAKGRVVDDVHKRPTTKVASPVGPILLVGALAGEAIAYFTFGSMVPVAVLSAAGVAFAVGLADDLFVLGGKTKPLILLLAGGALVAFIAAQPDLYNPAISFPILGDTAPHFIIYTLLAIVSFPIVANAFNMMDSFNGQLPWFTVLVSLALIFGATLHAMYAGGFSLARVSAALPLLAVAAGFLVFNRFPSRAFDGDSGSLMFGAMFAGLAITSGVEVAAMIAIVPAILNSFYTLSSVRGFVERRKMPSRPTYLGEDGKLHASTEANAPATLVRLILLAGPLTEQDLVKGVVTLTAVACLLSAGISILTWVH